MLLINRTGAFSLALALTACGLPLAAQSGGTCNPQVTGFVLEHPVDLTTIKSTLPQSISSDVLSQIASGAKEARSRTTYNVATRILNSDLFLSGKGSASPTPDAAVAASRFAFSVVYVDKVLQSCTPAPAVVVTGYVADGTPVYANPTGAPFVYSFAYIPKPASPNPFANPGYPQFRDVVTASGGVSLFYGATALGSIDFRSPTVPGGPSIVLSLPSGGGPYIASNSPYQVDASFSSDPGDGLQFQWASDKSAAFWPGNFSPVPLITFQNGAGDYNITLTVTNAAGVKAVSKFKLTYSPK